MINVFISYAREDEQIAREIFRFLESNGYDPWLDKKKLLPGMDWEHQIELAAKQSDLQIFVLSPRSIQKRGVFQREMRLALKKAEDLLESDISIIPLRLEECEVPLTLRKYQWVEYSNKDRDVELIAALRLAAEQRGLFSGVANSVPIVSEIVTYEDSELDGSVETSITVPKIFFPKNRALSEMVSALILGSASQVVLDFKSSVDKVRSKTYCRPHEVHVHTRVGFISNSVLSAEIGVYTDSLGAHGYGYTNSMNILVDEKRIFSCNDMFVNFDFLGDALATESAKTNETPMFHPSELTNVLSRALSENTTLDSEGICVRFNQYEAFCYAHGPVVFHFSWDEMESSNENFTPFGKNIRRMLTGKN